MEKLSSRFEERWGNESRSLAMSEYEESLNEWQMAYEKKIRNKWVISILLFCAGLWAVYENATFMAVLLLALAATYYLNSAHHIVLYEIMNQNKFLAMLINKQSQDIQSLRTEIMNKGEK